jgi:CRISPR-associated protein Cmr2
VIPWGTDGTEARALAARCISSAKNCWLAISEKVHAELDKVIRQKLAHLDPKGWDRRWSEQIQSYFEFRTSILPWQEGRDEKKLAKLMGKASLKEVYPEIEKIRSLVKTIAPEDRPGYAELAVNAIGQWQAMVDLCSRLMEAERTLRPIPPHSTGEQSPLKCSLLGSYEQMGPDDLAESRRFWQAASDPETGVSLGGVRLRDGERFCAVTLTKRFAGPVYFSQKLHLEGAADLRFPDTATVAASLWLQQAELDPAQIRQEHQGKWNGHWLHPAQDACAREEAPPDELRRRIVQAVEQHHKPPVYYAVLMMDGDEMGRWLRGEKAPRMRQVLHPKMVDYFQKQSEKNQGLDSHRPLSPALHASISEALANFSLYVARPVVEKHGGVLIYSGGDDVLALLPTAQAVLCAHELRCAFSGTIAQGDRGWQGYYPLAGDHQAPGRALLMMGPEASLSAGMAIVHYKEDLRFAMAEARRAERLAKNAGRDALELVVVRRSGEHTGFLCPWDQSHQISDLVREFAAGASDRWTYHLRMELSTLRGLPQEAVCAEIMRHIRRSEKETQGRIKPEAVARAYENYRASLRHRERPEDEILEQFITLCQSASFLARGRDAE